MKSIEPVLKVRNLNKNFITKHGIHTAVNNVSFQVNHGEVVGLIGQSGSGKSTVANGLMRLLKNVNGVVTLDGKVVSGKLPRKREKAFYRNVQMIFQDPHTSLNEKRNVFSTIAEPLLVHGIIQSEARKFLSLENDVMTSWSLTLKNEFYSREFQINEFIAKTRIKFLSDIIKELEKFEVKTYQSDSEAENALNILLETYFEELAKGKNSCLSKTINESNYLLDFYEAKKATVISRDLPVDEIELLDAKQALNDYKESFDDIEIGKKIKIAQKQCHNEIRTALKETSEILGAFIMDKKSRMKMRNSLASVAKTVKAHEAQKNLHDINALHLHSLRQLRSLKLAIPKELLYEYEAKLADLKTTDAVTKLNTDYHKQFTLLSAEFIEDVNAESSRIIAKLAKNQGKEKVVDPQEVERLESVIAQKQAVYDKERDKALKESAEFLLHLDNQKTELGYEEKHAHIVMLRMQAAKLLHSKMHHILEQIKDRELVKRKKLQYRQHLQHIKAYDIEEKQLLKQFRSIKLIYQIKQSSKIIRYFIVRRLLLQKRIISALVQVGLKPEHAYRYPHEFSGGQKQRINIARALIVEPKLIIADEPIASLDISIQAQVINILIDLVKKKGISMIFIGHDLSVIEYIADSILVMHLGRVVEKGLVNSVFKNPLHPYTKTLFASIPKVSTANEPFKSVSVDLSYISEYETSQPSYKIVAPHHLLLANDKQLKRWTENKVVKAETYSTDVYQGQKFVSKLKENVEELLDEHLGTIEVKDKK